MKIKQTIDVPESAIAKSEMNLLSDARKSLRDGMGSLRLARRWERIELEFMKTRPAFYNSRIKMARAQRKKAYAHSIYHFKSAGIRFEYISNTTTNDALKKDASRADARTESIIHRIKPRTGVREVRTITPSSKYL